ncbi:hypothetical protein B0H14DRAFT_2572491 [Mycena olivaceomarginata]|nr:hypothetical protein B0H14DRAFT_2572491 [Mycena olivaceomarginata]
MFNPITSCHIERREIFKTVVPILSINIITMPTQFWEMLILCFPSSIEPVHWDNLERAPRQGQDNWPGCIATIKAFSIGQKEFVTGQATFQSVPQNSNGGRRLPGYDLDAPRTQTEVVACQAMISMPPEPKRRSQNPNGGRRLPGYDLNAPRTQNEVIACQATISMPPEPKRRSQVARLPGHDLNAPRTQTEVVACQATISIPPEPKKEDRSLPGYDLDAPRTQTEVAACQATSSIPPEPKQK